MYDHIVPFKFVVHEPDHPEDLSTDVTEDDDALLERSGHRIIADENCMYCWGGYNPDYWDADNNEDTEYPLLKELWKYHYWQKKWTLLRTHGDVPTELASHTVCKLGKHLLHFGGTSVPFGHTASNDLYDLDLDRLQWTKCDVRSENNDQADFPRPKYGHTMTQVGAYIYIVGGTSGFMYDCDVHRYDLRNKLWAKLQPESQYVPVGRYRHETIHYNGKLYMFGGGTGNQAHGLQRIDVFNIEQKRWTTINAVPHRDAEFEMGIVPTARRCHSCTRFRDDVYLVGGMTLTRIKSTTWVFNLPTHQWTSLGISLPRPVYFHGADISPDGWLLTFGGVTRIDNERTNCLQSMCLVVPELKMLTWGVVVSLIDVEKSTDNRHILLSLGIPVQFLDKLL